MFSRVAKSLDEKGIARKMTWDSALETAFHPKAVAVVGVSAEGRRNGMRGGGGVEFILSYQQLGFPGRIYPVNPKATEILGLKAYPSVSSIPEPVDLVIVSVPAPAVPGVLQDCAAANARNIHLFTAGFEETGEEEARELGRRVREIASREGLRVIGPNCMGLYVPEAGIGPFVRLPRESGPVSFISQSGGHCNWFCHYGANYGVHFSKVISFGNAYVLDSTDYLEYLSVDPETKLICLYLEGVKDGGKLLKQVKAINPLKPVLLWKAGLTESGARAAASHTASLAGQEALWRGFFAQTGAVRISSLEELAETVMTFLHVKPPRGNRVAVLGSGGGSSVSSADICASEGLQVPPLTAETQAELKRFVPLAGFSTNNPLDTGLIFRDVSLLTRELELISADPHIDMVIVMPHLDMVRLAGPEQVDRLLSDLEHFSKDNPYGKPTVVVFHSFANDPWETEMRAKLQMELPQKGVAVYSSLAGACRALAKLSAYYRYRKGIEADIR